MHNKFLLPTYDTFMREVYCLKKMYIEVNFVYFIPLVLFYSNVYINNIHNFIQTAANKKLPTPAANQTTRNKKITLAALAFANKKAKLSIFVFFPQTNRKMINVLLIYVLMAIGNSVSAYKPACLPIKHEEYVSSGEY